MRTENAIMQKFLSDNGIKAKAKYIADGSLKNSWRLYNPLTDWYNNPELWAKLTSLGFTTFRGEPLGKFEGNGGVFSVFLRFDRTPEFINSTPQTQTA